MQKKYNYKKNNKQKITIKINLKSQNKVFKTKKPKKKYNQMKI